jgi:hypothetical protein
MREAAIAVAAQSTRGSMTELPATPPTGSGAERCPRWRP